jgi:RimJ/RimL family protein N-acetyltransferase
LSLTPELWDRIAEDGAMKEGFKLSPDFTYLLMTLGKTPIGFWSVHKVNNATLMIHCNVLEEYRKEHYTEFGRLIYQWFIDESKPKYMRLVAEVPVIFESVCKYCEFFKMGFEGLSPKSEWRGGYLVDRKMYGISRNEIEEYLRDL